MWHTVGRDKGKYVHRAQLRIALEESPGCDLTPGPVLEGDIDSDKEEVAAHLGKISAGETSVIGVS